MGKMTVILGLFVGAMGLVGVASSQPGLGGGGGGFGGFGQNDPLRLLNDPAVKKELELTDEQAAAVPEAVVKALSGVLNEKQFARFKQIELQQRGNAAFTDAKIQEKLKFTSAQKDSVKTILEDSKKERDALGGVGKGNFEKFAALRKETTEKLNGVLTSDQQKAWRDMTGETVKLSGFGGGGFRKGGDAKKGETKKKTSDAE